MTLDQDIGPCPEGGLAVTGGDVTLDLNGHSITGSGPGSGILITVPGDGNAGNVSVTNGLRLRIRYRHRHPRRQAHGRMSRPVDHCTRSTRSSCQWNRGVSLRLFRMRDERHSVKEQNLRR